MTGRTDFSGVVVRVLVLWLLGGAGGAEAGTGARDTTGAVTAGRAGDVRRVRRTNADALRAVSKLVTGSGTGQCPR